jgi:uncharacterized protein (TIGR02646 family)
MKYIAKGPQPQALSEWKASGNDNWHPTYDNLDSDTKSALKEALMAEQGYLCCYCESRVTLDDSHIEHFRPQSDESVDPLDFSNMLCSCQSQGKTLHCGHRKGDWFDGELLISPLDPSCESRFSFAYDGHIMPASEDDVAAKETIERLGLDIGNLVESRAKAIEPFLDDALTEEDLKGFVSGYLQKDSRGAYGAFWTSIRYLFGGYVPAWKSA